MIGRRQLARPTFGFLRNPRSPGVLLGHLGGFLVGLFVLLGPTPAWSQADGEWPSSVEGLKVVIPNARGKPAWGGRKLTRSLRKTLSQAVGPLVPSAKLKRAQRKLRLRGKRARSPEGLAAAAERIGAQYVLSVEITKKGWRYSARAILINAETAEIQMNFRSDYFKPRSEAKDRGFRIGRKTIEKLDILLQDGPAPFAEEPEEAPPPPIAEPEPEPEPEPTIDETEDELAAEEPEDPQGIEPEDEELAEPTPAEPQDPEPDLRDEEPAVRAERDPPRETRSRAPAREPAQEQDEPVTAQVQTKRKRADDLEVIRFSISGGAGLVHTYDLSSQSVSSSALSHRLSPISLIQADLEITVPQTPVTIRANTAYRPLKYAVEFAGQGERDLEPAGMLLDARFALGWSFFFAGSGRDAIRLIPTLGTRFSLSRVNEHPGNAILSSTLSAIVGGTVLRWPINKTFELNLGVEVGLILSYSESPTASGNNGGGITLGTDIGGRIWVSDSVAVAIDMHFGLDSIGFDGVPSRQHPDNETGRLEDVSVVTKDLRTSVGIAFRF